MSLRAHLLAALALAVAATGCPSPDEPTGPDAQPPIEPFPDEPDAGPGDELEPDAGPGDELAPDAQPAVEPEPDARPGNVTPDGCTAWQVALDQWRPEGTITTADVVDGALVLATEGDDEGESAWGLATPSGAISLYQGKLQGDFDVVVEVDGLEGAGAFAGLALFVSNDAGQYTSFVQSKITAGTGFTPNLVTANLPSWGSGTELAHGVSTTKVTLRIQRVGSRVTASGVAGDAEIAPVSTTMTTDLLVGLSLSPFDQARKITARIASFTVTGGGGAVMSDDFDVACARALAP